MKLHVQKWNKREQEYTMFILTDDDIINNNQCVLKGVGIDILVLSKKYEETDIQIVNLAKVMVLARKGEIIYV